MHVLSTLSGKILKITIERVYRKQYHDNSSSLYLCYNLQF